MILTWTVTKTGVRRKLKHSPRSTLRIHRNEFWFDPDAPPAIYRDGEWQFQDSVCLILRMDSPVRVQFERNRKRSKVYGPFTPVYLLNGFVYYEGEEVPLGDFDVHTLLWTETKTGEKWTGLIFVDASAQARPAESGRS